VATSVLLGTELVVDNRQSRRRVIEWLIVAGVLVVVLVLWGGWWYLSAYWYGSDMATRGQFGDLFGGVNALFTGLAFVALIYTLYLQRKDLEMQREDLAVSRDELRNSVDAQRGQVEQLERASSLSAISTLIASYGRKLDNIAEDDVRLNLELRQKRESLKTSKDTLETMNDSLRPLTDELYRRRKELAEITDPVNRAHLDSERQKLIATIKEDQEAIERQEQAVSKLVDDIERLEVHLSNNEIKRDATNHKHEALVFHLEKLVEASIEQTISDVGNIPSEEAVGGPGAAPPTPPQASPNDTT
jgi:DNA-binding transcriptional regulator of glucitol operon